jgi:hypothetical protein
MLAELGSTDLDPENFLSLGFATGAGRGRHDFLRDDSAGGNRSDSQLALDGFRPEAMGCRVDRGGRALPRRLRRYFGHHVIFAILFTALLLVTVAGFDFENPMGGLALGTLRSG